ncbi:MAG: hypothetical protein LBE20_04815 [Deltaproteobacteria bacterium]|jgi:hypothetical protein|nr:hypothetical protein [Deltaproteobacteria bacterium]
MQDRIKQVLQKSDLSEEQLKNSCSRVRTKILQNIQQQQASVKDLFSFNYNPLLGLASCCLGIILSFLVQNNHNFINQNEFEMFSNADYTVISFLNIIEE